jgi:hypothetical protein
MKAMQRIKRATAWSLSALTLSALLLCAVACTGGGDPAPGGTTGGTTATTTPATGRPDAGTNRPLDPGAGTVTPNGDAGDPPTGTDGGSTTRAHRSDFMH